MFLPTTYSILTPLVLVVLYRPPTVWSPQGKLAHQPGFWASLSSARRMYSVTRDSVQIEDFFLIIYKKRNRFHLYFLYLMRRHHRLKTLCSEMTSLVLHDHNTVHQNDRQTRHRHDDLPQVPTCCSCHIMGYSYVYPPLSKNSDRLDGHSGGSFYVYDFVKYSWENKYFRNQIPSHYIS